MSPLADTDGIAPNIAAVERRHSARFPMSEPVSFRMLDRRGATHDGVGVTVNMSRSGVLFMTENPPAQGRLIEMSIHWPVALGGTCALKIVAAGHVVRASGSWAAVKIEKYQFKTRGRTPALAI